ncbi:MAG: hypothetical protein JNN13_03590 [Planctomycetes bacterium]|nr:hypothetical protein [Planctomycetota bacterium]
MPRPVSLTTFAAFSAAALSLTGGLAAQNCYDAQHRCFTFGPAPESDVGKVDTQGALDLRSQKLSVEGDIRLRLRTGDTRTGYPYNGLADQQATRARVRLHYQATEKVKALAEFNFSETWAGSESYSDAMAGENFNGISQFYLDAEDMFGFGDHWRVGRSEYILGNGLVLGSCDYLQRPGTFTGVWFSRPIAGHDFELFMFDDYGPLQAAHDGVRYVGGTASINFGDCCGGMLGKIKPYYMAGTHDGDEVTSANETEDDQWLGIDGLGTLPGDIQWNAEWAQRFVDAGEDRMAWRATLTKKLGLCGGAFDSVSLQHTDAEGKMDVGNPADFNSAGLLHQYGGAWRSDMQTTQLGLRVLPGQEISIDVNLLAFDRRGGATQQGEYEADFIVGRKFASGVYASAGYGVDDDRRQVGYFQLTLNF